ncbi:MAG: hypothetical protein GX442_13825 [Candidatus Riflebacteria bacterium]|nr:hypothetical protein [Candidatus Riflebacteria bacterium]
MPKHVLLLRLPEGQDGRLVRGVTLQLRLGEWAAQALRWEAAAGPNRIHACFPTTRDHVKA